MLEEKCVVITGANGALGSAAVQTALDMGAAKVIAIDLKFSNTSSNDRVTQVELNLLDKDACAHAVSDFDKVDILFNIAGGFTMGSKAYDTASDDWTKMFQLNVETVRNMVANTVPIMIAKSRGAIVNVGALSALQGQADMSAYIAAKAAVMRLTESLAAELGGHGINVNAVLPSIIDTPQNRQDMPDADHAQWVSPRDLSSTMCFLGSDLGKAINGALVPVAGGVI